MTGAGLFLIGLLKGFWTRLLRPLLRWLVADWRNAPLLALALIAANDQLRVKPALRAERDSAITQRDAVRKALDGTIQFYREAQVKAAAADAANKRRVEAEQARISQETADDYQNRIADARASYDRIAATRLAEQLRRGAKAPTDPGRGGSKAVPGLSAATGGAAETAGEDRLPAPGELSLDDALTATEQAIQLDELISWAERQAKVNVEGEQAGADR